MADRNQIFMRLTGDKVGEVLGDCEVATRRNWIELDDWNWSLGREDKNDAIEPSPFAFSKMMDRSSTTMMEAMKLGDELVASIVVEDASQRDFALLIELGGVRIVGYELSAASDKEDTVEESWLFDYEVIRFEHRPDAGAKSAPAEIHRRPGLSNEPPEKGTAELKKLAMTLGLADRNTLDKLWKEIEAELDEKKVSGKPAATTPGTPPRTGDTRRSGK